MSTKFNQPTDPIFLVTEELKKIIEEKETLKIPIVSFNKTSDRLKKKGVTIIVTLELNGKTELVPFRVETPQLIRFGWYKSVRERILTSWHKRQIHHISPSQYDNDSAPFKVREKLIQCLKRSIHYLIRKLTLNALKEKKAGSKALKRSQRQERRDSYQRFHAPGMAY